MTLVVCWYEFGQQKILAVNAIKIKYLIYLLVNQHAHVQFFIQNKEDI